MAGSYFDFGNMPIEKDTTLKAKWCCEEPEADAFTVEFLDSGVATFCNKWNDTITIDGVRVAGGDTKPISVTAGQRVVVVEYNNNGAFRKWRTSGRAPFVSGIRARVASTPPMSRFTTDEEGTTAGDYFFFGFNYSGSIVEFPAGAFDTSKITNFGSYNFRYFNYQNTVLTSLPAGSFNFDSAQAVGRYFCQSFNSEATRLTSLPANSFNFPNLTTIGDSMFGSFNFTGSIADLPDGSFQFPKLTATIGGFCYFFNAMGQISQLPKDSFDMSAVTSANGATFAAFNGEGTQVGKLARDNTSYTNTKNVGSSAVTAYYYPSGSENVPVGGQFHWKMKTT